MNLFRFLKGLNSLKNGQKGVYITRDPRGCDVACKATLQSHADPRECLRGTEVTSIYIIFIIHSL